MPKTAPQSTKKMAWQGSHQMGHKTSKAMEDQRRGNCSSAGHQTHQEIVGHSPILTAGPAGRPNASDAMNSTCKAIPHGGRQDAMHAQSGSGPNGPSWARMQNMNGSSQEQGPRLALTLSSRCGCWYTRGWTKFPLPQSDAISATKLTQKSEEQTMTKLDQQGHQTSTSWKPACKQQACWTKQQTTPKPILKQKGRDTLGRWTHQDQKA